MIGDLREKALHLSSDIHQSGVIAEGERAKPPVFRGARFLI